MKVMHAWLKNLKGCAAKTKETKIKFGIREHFGIRYFYAKMFSNPTFYLCFLSFCSTTNAMAEMFSHPKSYPCFLSFVAQLILT